MGRLKHLLQVVKRVEKKLDRVERKVCRIEAHYKRSVDFERSDVLDVCVDEVDVEILQLLFEAGSPGVLPKDLAAGLERFGVTRFQVSRRIVRMNRKLWAKLEEHVAEQRGWHWALTSFTVENWGKSE